MGAVVVTAVVAGLLVLGSPQDERARRLDEARVEDLQQLRMAIDAHYRREGRLPATLDGLTSLSPLELRATDPEGGQPYHYEAIDSSAYRLCATFRFATPEVDEARFAYRSWAHGAGRQCFRFRARLTAPEDRPRPEDEIGPVLEGVRDSAP